MVVQTFNLSMQEIEEGISLWAGGQQKSYAVRPCLKQRKEWREEGREKGREEQ